jgi:hypothetical protein
LQHTSPVIFKYYTNNSHNNQVHLPKHTVYLLLQCFFPLIVLKWLPLIVAPNLTFPWINYFINHVYPVRRSKNNDANILQHLEILLVETIKSTILSVLQNQKHITTLTQIWETQQTTHRVPCTLEIKTTVVFTFLMSLPLQHPSRTTIRARTSGKPLISLTGSKPMEWFGLLRQPWTLLLTRAPPDELA